MSSDAAFYGDGSKLMSAKVASEGNPRSVQSIFSIDEYYETSRCVEWLNSHSDSSLSRVRNIGMTTISLFHHIIIIAEEMGGCFRLLREVWRNLNLYAAI